MHPGSAPAGSAQRQQYQRCRRRILPAEAELLHQTARALLDQHGIDEPVPWTPKLPARALHNLVLPGPAPDSVSIAELHRAPLSGTGRRLLRR
ncbi:hypothetical protein ABT025_30505 [Streptomyces sp. NPDC002809]|uniref:hypothetical protein n=1 Tax=Streptomyces sp. NPDC002809 TaxID=3154433 RepID=UPI00331A2488